MKFFETKNIFSKPKSNDILFESIKSFAITLNESKKTKGEMISVYFEKGLKKHLTITMFVEALSKYKWRTAKLLIDSNNMSYFFGFEKNASCFVFKNRKGHPVS